MQTNETLKKQLEEDAEIEIEEMKMKYELKLQEEREATLRLKGENGIMKKKFSAIQKDIEDQKEKIRSLEEKGKELFENIKGLEKDIQGHNALLTMQVNELRREFHNVKMQTQDIRETKQKNQHLAGNKKHKGSAANNNELLEKMREAEFQREHILQLKERLTSLQKVMGGGLNFALTASSSPQQQQARKPLPPSSQRLPPV